jgi:hypothetical protein
MLDMGFIPDIERICKLLPPRRQTLFFSATMPPEITRLVAAFRELREGVTQDGKAKLKVPSGTLSTAEAISATLGAWSEAAYFGTGAIDADTLAANFVGAVVKDPVQDRVVLEEYLETVVKKRKGWGDLYSAVRAVL